jgi:signal transduction histidine kinase
MGTNSSLSEKISANRYLPYLVAIGCALSASLICGLLRNFVSSGECHVLLFLVVTFCAWYCGVAPAVTAIVIILLGSTFGFIPNLHSFAMPSAIEFAGSLVFLLSSIVVILMGETRRHQNEALLRAQTELEERVRERTSDLDAVNRSLRELSARLMQLQDDERRRIARELHDSVGQTLAALAMNLSLVRGDLERLASITVALNDSENLVRDMSKEVRTISHLLHPPLLDEAGLASALRWYVDGFVQRSRIQVDLDLPEDFPRLPSEVETAVFRVVQECLTNIHRHSGSPVARIHVRQRHEQVLVDIEDQGKGIPLEKREEMATAGTPGVGIRGMRERLRQLGGTLEINSNSGGTVVTVQLPLEDKAGSDTETLVDPAAA